uniref:Uncharacterized protein n=1 Tax=Micrurus lemniscatus lemniscatus TaxID=129467 RepID=A0A2D4IVZ9_MICLE
MKSGMMLSTNKGIVKNISKEHEVLLFCNHFSTKREKEIPQIHWLLNQEKKKFKTWQSLETEPSCPGASGKHLRQKGFFMAIRFIPDGGYMCGCLRTGQENSER